MSAFQQRNRGKACSDSTQQSGCYAIASDASSFSGIYFSYDEARQKILETRTHSDVNVISSSNGVVTTTTNNKDVVFRRFNKIRDAEAFLKDQGFTPKEQAGGWISARNKNPILYTHSTGKENNQCATRNSENNLLTGQHHQHQFAAEVTPSVRSTNKISCGDNDLQRLWGDHNQGTKENYDELPSERFIDLTSPMVSAERNTEPIEPAKPATTTPSKTISSFFEPGRKWVEPPKETKKRGKSEQMPYPNEGAKQRERVRKRRREQSVVPGKPVYPERNQRNANDSSERPAAAVARLFAGSPPDFDPIQQEAIDAAMNGKNVFLTGVAGTGKSLVTKKIVEDAKNFGREVAVAAPTGVAAVNLGPELGAQTVHSLAGVGVPETASGFDKMLKPWKAKKWRSIEVLVLDEIGMLQADFLDWLDVYVRKARRRPLDVFGGIQLIFVGDFAQLGPIAGGGHSIRNKAYAPDDPAADHLMGINECVAYAFQTVLWREAKFHHVHLRKVYRQKNRDFQMALMDIREAKAYSQRVTDLVDTCSTPLKNREGLEIPADIKPTVLYCTNKNVDKENFENLAKLTDKGKVFEAIDSTEVSAEVSPGSHAFIDQMLTRNSFFKDCSSSKKIHLKVGAQVMLCQNLDVQKGLVNGSRGVVEAFKLCPVAKAVISGEEQLIGPDDMDKFPGCRFEDIKFHQQADFGGKIWRICRFERFPLVRFVNNTSRIIVPFSFERTLYRQGKCIRKQIPLRLAWALTIHKSQGATLDYVVCDLQGCFTSGQAYVALSRARSMLGLQIKNFSAKTVTADPLVEEFYDALDRHDMSSFLEEKAGIWWFPILRAPSWFKMFHNASSKNAKSNSEQFRAWVQEYKPIDGYRGWGV